MKKLRIKRFLLVAACMVLHLLFSPSNQTTVPVRPVDHLKCKLLDVTGKELQSPPDDGAVIFSVTIFGEARVANVIQMLNDLLDAGNDEGNPFPRQAAMIAVSGNETLVPLLEGLSERFSPLETRLIVASIERDYGPISRVVAADICFSPSKNYTIVVGDDDMVYNPRAVFVELPDYLRRVQQRLTNTSAAMVGYFGMHWTYPFVQWGPFVHGGRFNDAKWNNERDAAESEAFCMDSREPNRSNLPTDTSSLCEDIIPTGLLECYGLVAFHRSAISPRLYEKHHHPDFLTTCFWGDDFWLSYYAFRMSIPRFVVRSRVVNPSAVLITKLPQPDGSVGSKAGGRGNLINYRNCERTMYKNQGNCSWCI